MGHSVKASLWCDSLSTLDFASFISEWAIVKRIWCYNKTKSFQTTQGGYQVIIILPIKSKMAATKKQYFFAFSILNWVFTYRHLKSEVYKWLLERTSYDSKRKLEMAYFMSDFELEMYHFRNDHAQSFLVHVWKLWLCVISSKCTFLVKF